MRLRTLVVIVLALAASATLTAMYAMVDVRNVPVERVTQNLERELAKNPKDVKILVRLARVHAIAFAQKRDTVPSAVPLGMGKPAWEITPYLGEGVPSHTQPQVRPTSDPKAETVAKEHLQRAITRYREALAIDPEHLVAKIGLGWTLLQTGDKPGATAALRDVISKAWVDDKSGIGPKGEMVTMGHRFMTEEAARYLMPLLDPARDSAEIDDLRQKVRQLERQIRAITPIVVPLEDGLAAIDIEDHAGRVAFDADGSGMPKRWTWIRPNAGWLVFDRYSEGRITSGLQLFGSVTFWLFWDNGYDALRSLDDNGDGAVSGGELAGLAIWSDSNSNGVSERGEVKPVAGWGITSLSCAYEHDATHPDEIAFSPRGVTFADGKVRPTFDLILRSVR